MNEHTQISLRLSRIMMNQVVQGKASLLQDKLIVISNCGNFLSVLKLFPCKWRLLSSSYNLCKRMGSRSRLTFCRS